ncbi:MAG: hypothetical protein MK214_07730 [Thalassotalea sp.]|nr:hypothetical protein [Thalassotalea sp.]
MNKPSLIWGFLFLFSFQPAHAKSFDISVIWQHADKSATLLVDLAKAEISVHQPDENPKANGLVIIKEITEIKPSRKWHVQMYNAAENNFVKVDIHQENCKVLGVYDNDKEILKVLRNNKHFSTE